MKNFFKISLILVFLGWGMMGCTGFMKDSAPVPTSSRYPIAFSPDGKLTLSYSNGTLSLWQVSTGRMLRTFKGDSSYVNAVVFSPDSKLALSGGRLGMRLWEVATGRMLRRGFGYRTRNTAVNSVAFSPDGKLALSGSSDNNTMKLWEILTGNELMTFKESRIAAVAFSPDGKFAFSLSSSYMNVWQVDTGVNLRKFKLFLSEPFALSHDGKLVLARGRGEIKLYQLDKKDQVDRNTMMLNVLTTVIFDAKYEEVDRERVRPKVVKINNIDRVNVITFYHNNQLVLFGGDRSTPMKLFQVSTGRELKRFKGNSYNVNAMVFSPDGKLVFSQNSSDKSTRLWNVETGKEIVKMVIKNGEWVTRTPEGYYVSSANTGGYIDLSSKFNQPEKVKLALKPFVSASPVQVATVQPIQTSVVKPKIQPKPKPKPTDNAPPRIVLNAKTRGPTNELVANTNSYTLNGQAIDDSKIAFVIVNGKKVKFNRQGYFNIQLALELGKNRISVTAGDIHNNVSSKNIVLSRQNIQQSPIHFAGNYHALVIGINQYKYLKNLNTAVNDARTVAKVLKTQYGFSAKLLLDKQATRDNIMSAFNKLNNSLDKNDHLLIYYAGHGYYDKKAKAAYWLPTDAKNDEDTKWLYAGSITTHLKRNQAKNVLVVADSCYSGTLTLTRSVEINLNAKPKERQHFLKKMFNKKSRVLISSGGNEPVTDSGGQGHSIFAQAFLDGLREIEATVFTAEELFIKGIQQYVAGNTEQTPEFQIIRQSGHKGGDFVFQRK